jgi:hypothetical protein
MATGADALLMFAVTQGDAKQASTLIVEANANVNTTNTNGTSCCHVCVAELLTIRLPLTLETYLSWSYFYHLE